MNAAGSPAGGRSTLRSPVLLAVLAAVAAGLVAVLIFSVRERSDKNRALLAHQGAKTMQGELIRYYRQHGNLPAGSAAFTAAHEIDPHSGAPVAGAGGEPAYTITAQSGTITVIFGKDQGALSGRTLVYSPRFGRGGLEWDCHGGTLQNNYRVPECQAS